MRKCRLVRHPGRDAIIGPRDSFSRPACLPGRILGIGKEQYVDLEQKAAALWSVD